jgi:hypothetical protein
MGRATPLLRLQALTAQTGTIIIIIIIIIIAGVCGFVVVVVALYFSHAQAIRPTHQ